MILRDPIAYQYPFITIVTDDKAKNITQLKMYI